MNLEEINEELSDQAGGIMYIKKQVKREIYAMHLNGITVEDIAENKGIKTADAEKAIIEWESALRRDIDTHLITRTFLHMIRKETVAKAVCDTAEKTGQTRDIVEEILGFRCPEVTVTNKDDRKIIHEWNGLYTYCQCVKRKKAEEARRYYAICQGQANNA